MNSDWLRLIDLLIEGFFLGFGLTVFLSLLLSLTRIPKLKKFHTQFVQNAIKLIRIIGILYFIYFLILFVKNFDRTINYNEDKYDLFRTIFFVSRSILLVVFTQLFWLKKVKDSKFIKPILILFIFILASYAPYIIERVLFFLNYYSRDFFPEMMENRKVPLHLKVTIVLFFIERIVYFSILVFLTWIISKNATKKKLKNGIPRTTSNQN